MLKDLFRMHKIADDSYAKKYKQYFEFDSIKNWYCYRIHLRSYNDNKYWPLDSCPKCSLNLNKYPADELKYKVGAENYSKFNAAITTFSCLLLIALAFAFSEYDYMLILFIIMIAVDIAILINHINITKPIIIYYCPKCKTLLYSKSPDKIFSTDPPKIVFSQLERLSGFKLE